MFIFKKPPVLPRTFRPVHRVTELLLNREDTTTVAPDPETNAVVLDARGATSLSDLDWLYRAAQKHADTPAFRQPGGRVVVIRSGPTSTVSSPEAVAVSEAMVGFAKSLAKENGARGATVNLLQDISSTGVDNNDTNIITDSNNDTITSNYVNKDPVDAPLDWLLSHHSCYVTGQELVVSRPPPPQPTGKQEGAILITGAAGGIGKATAQFLCQEHNDTSNSPSNRTIMLLDHPSTTSQLEILRQDLMARNRDNVMVETLSLDMTQPEAGPFISQAGIDLGGLQRIVHAAGITRDKTLRNMDFDKEWNSVLDVNLRAILEVDRCLQTTPGALVPDRASFVYFGSTSGIAGNAGQSNYAATKSGLLGYAPSMAGKYPQHTFHIVSPGFIATDMTQKMPYLVRMVASKLNALGQAGQPEDVAAAVAFLSSAKATGLEPGFHLRVCGLFMGGR